MTRQASLVAQTAKSLPAMQVLLLFSYPVMSHSLQTHGLQHAWFPRPSPSPEVCPSSCPLHQWCHPASSSCDALFSFCLQSFPASGTFPVSHLFATGDQNTGASASASVLPMSIQGWFPLRLTSLIPLLSKGLSGVFSSTTVWNWFFHSPCSPSSRGSLDPLHFLPLEWCHPHIWGCWCFSHLSWFQLVTPPAWSFSHWAQHAG